MSKKGVNLEDFSSWYALKKQELLIQAKEWKEKNDALKKQFLQEWPLERLGTMSIDEYVIGKGAQNKSFCYEIENGKYKDLYLSIKGGTAGKFGIYWSKDKNAYCDQRNQEILSIELNEKFQILKEDLLSIISKGVEANFTDAGFSLNNSFYNRTAMITKLLCIYTEDIKFSGVNMSNDRKEIWNHFIPSEKQGGAYKQNYEITLALSKRYPELSDDLLSGILWEYRKDIIKQNESKKTSEKNGEGSKIAYQNKYSEMLLASKNIIFRGAPGTGKTYLANQIAADIVSSGRTPKIEKLTSEEKTQIGFVQFHPSYDYTDFVEGLRPSISDEGIISFTLKPGSFKLFVEKALEIEPENEKDNFLEAWRKFFDEVTEAGIIGTGYNKLTTLTGKPVKNLLTYEKNGMEGVYPADTTIYLNYKQIYNVYRGLPGTPKGGFDSYRKSIVKLLKLNYGLKEYEPASLLTANERKYVFIIDEINRGEISKIFGELFFSLDPGYRGNKEGILTQYANLHENPTEKFYIPDNVYIIGTMNDIDRSVDTFDFAMRRRFTFFEISAEESAENMIEKEEIKELMKRLNSAIVDSEIGGLTEEYMIGASYFIDLDSINEKDITPLWLTKLKPLLKDYFRGEYQAKEKLEQLEKVFFAEVKQDEIENFI